MHASSAMSRIAFNAPSPTHAHSAQLTSPSQLSEVIAKHVIWQTASIVMDQTTAIAVPHHTLLTQEDVFSAVLVVALFARLQISVHNANPETQQTTEPFALAATSSNVEAALPTISVKPAITISQSVLQEPA